MLSGMEAINCKAFDNPIARGSYIIDIHDPSGRARAIGGDIKGDYYDIPYGCLISKTYNNLLSCGRCISVDHIAHSSTRIQGTCIQTGQAAGTAAAMANAGGISPKQISTKALHEQLINDGMYL